MKRLLFSAALACLFFTACKKNDDPAYNSTIMANLSVEFDNVAGPSDLALNTGSYTNAAGEQLTITKVKYYVSNFILTNADGTVYTVPQDSCYFLIDESNDETHEPNLHIPEGEYKTVSFVVGVDSARSTKNLSQRTGVLAPSSDMYWNADSGYVFFNLEGKSPAAPTAGNKFTYHIGGYSSANMNNLKTVTLDLTPRGTPKVKSGKQTNIHLFVDVLKAFSGATNVSIAAAPVVGYDPFSTIIADNYSSMFRHDHTEN